MVINQYINRQYYSPWVLNREPIHLISRHDSQPYIFFDLDGVTGDDSHSVFVTSIRMALSMRSHTITVIMIIQLNFGLVTMICQNGTYTYTVTDSSGNTSVEFSDHVIVNQIPCVSQGSISIKPNGTSPTINWAALSKDTVTHYQIDIRDDSNNNVQYLHVKDNSILIPPGFLAPPFHL